MPKRTIEIPEGMEQFGDAVEAMLRKLEEFKAVAAKDGEPVKFSEFERAIDASTDAVRLDVKRRALQDLDIDADHILVDGERYAQVGRYEAPYFTKEGEVRVTRSLYRQCGRRNAKTVDAVSLRAGALDGWLPEASKAVAFLLQQGTSREAEATGRVLGTLRYSRSSLERVAHDVGALHAAVREEVETRLMRESVIPDKARSVSVGLDRVAVPFEEPRPQPRGRPKKRAAKRPVERVWHMAYAGTVTLHDANGDALHTIRYGRTPSLGRDQLLDSMLADVQELLRRRPQLKLALLSDGAPELEDALDGFFHQGNLRTDPHRLIDFWHVIEKLGAAARVIHGEDAGPVIARWKLLLKNSTTAVSRILNELHGSGKREVRVGDERPVHDGITYLENHGDRMKYPAALAAGLPIGSGNVEATCKSLFRQRLVRAGARWKEDTAQHIVDLRALALSDRFDPAIALTLAPLIRHVRLAA